MLGKSVENESSITNESGNVDTISLLTVMVFVLLSPLHSTFTTEVPSLIPVNITLFPDVTFNDPYSLPLSIDQVKVSVQYWEPTQETVNSIESLGSTLDSPLIVS